MIKELDKWRQYLCYNPPWATPVKYIQDNRRPWNIIEEWESIGKWKSVKCDFFLVQQFITQNAGRP